MKIHSTAIIAIILVVSLLTFSVVPRQANATSSLYHNFTITNITDPSHPKQIADQDHSNFIFGPIIFGSTIQFTALSNDNSAVYGVEYWNPSGNIDYETAFYCGITANCLDGSAKTSYTLNQAGPWEIILSITYGPNGQYVNWYNVYINISYNVLPESPIGVLALSTASLAALGGFVYFRRFRNKAVQGEIAS
jgi:hypothetical protein